MLYKEDLNNLNSSLQRPIYYSADKIKYNEKGEACSKGRQAKNSYKLYVTLNVVDPVEADYRLYADEQELHVRER